MEGAMKRDEDRTTANQMLQHGASEWRIPLPPQQGTSRATLPSSRISNSSTPLLPIRKRKQNRSAQSAGEGILSYHDDRADGRAMTHLASRTRSRENNVTQQFHSNESRNPADHCYKETTNDLTRPTGLAGFFFGFMYEEPLNLSFDFDEEEDHSASGGSLWNSLNMALCCVYALTAAATTVPILLIPTIGEDLAVGSEDTSTITAMDTSGFASRAASSAVLGTAFGKFVNGPVSDVLGARRTSVLYSIMLAFSLLGMACCNDLKSVAWACFFVEFFQSVQWPCILITLATHFAPPPPQSPPDTTNKSSSYPSDATFNSLSKPSYNSTMYEGGIYLTSIASRFGSLLGIPFFSTFLHRSHWRVVCCMGAWMAMIAASVAYLFTADSPRNVNEPQNALHPSLLQQLASANLREKPHRCFYLATRVVHSVLAKNVIPSLQHVLKSGTFWIVALAHTGSSMVRTSERILSTYYKDTSMGYLTEDQVSGLSSFSSLGSILGLAIAGTIFSHYKERQRKQFVSNLYIITIAACYILALLAVPSLHRAMDAPGLILFFQVFASIVMGFGVAVMFYHIPSLVGSSFGNHKGLFSAYVDGVAYGMASVVWKIVANSVESGNGGGGWAYGWAAVALLMVLCAILMVEFMEHYFVRPSGRHHGTYETILFA